MVALNKVPERPYQTPDVSHCSQTCIKMAPLSVMAPYEDDDDDEDKPVFGSSGWGWLVLVIVVVIVVVAVESISGVSNDGARISNKGTVMDRARVFCRNWESRAPTMEEEESFCPGTVTINSKGTLSNKSAQATDRKGCDKGTPYKRTRGPPHDGCCGGTVVKDRFQPMEPGRCSRGRVRPPLAILLLVFIVDLVVVVLIRAAAVRQEDDTVMVERTYDIRAVSNSIFNLFPNSVVE